jgi:hypothetical protein
MFILQEGRAVNLTLISDLEPEGLANVAGLF